MNDKQKQQMAKLNTISNGEISITVSTAGAEMQNLKVLAGEREMLWQEYLNFGTDARRFSSRSGRTLERHLPAEPGKSYCMPKHGFMREKEWTLEEETADSLTYVYKDCGENREAFPWPYEVRVRYALEGRRVKATMIGFEPWATAPCSSKWADTLASCSPISTKTLPLTAT